MHSNGLSKVRSPPPITVSDYVLALESAEVNVQQLARECLGKELARRRRPMMTSLAFSVGDLVKVKGAERPTHKLLTPFVGPYHVTERQGDVYQLQDINTGRFVQRHVTHDVSDVRAFDAARTPKVRLLAAQAREHCTEQWSIETILDARTTLTPRKLPGRVPGTLDGYQRRSR